MAATCKLCGEPMPAGEEMFKYHGYSGPCPKRPLPKPPAKMTVAVDHVDDPDGDLWIEIDVNGKPYHKIGPFTSTAERQRASDDLTTMLRSVRPQ